MASIIGSIFSGTTNISADQIIAYNSAAGTADLAQAYLMSALGSPTPEVRRMYAEYCTQAVVGHETIMGIMINNSWANPYDTPEKQLQSVAQQTKPGLNTQH